MRAGVLWRAALLGRSWRGVAAVLLWCVVGVVCALTETLWLSCPQLLSIRGEARHALLSASAGHPSGATSHGDGV